MLRRTLFLPLILSCAVQSADARCRRPIEDAGDSLANTNPSLLLGVAASPAAETFPIADPEAGRDRVSQLPVQPTSGTAGMKPGGSLIQPVSAGPAANQPVAVKPGDGSGTAGASLPKPAANAQEEAGTAETQAAVSESASPEVGAAPTQFSITAGETLRTALTRWASGSGWELVWEAPQDYTISAPAAFDGGVRQAVTQLMESLRANGAPFGADIWEGNHVIRITRFR